MEVPEWKRQLLARRKSGSVTLVAGGARLVVTRPRVKSSPADDRSTSMYAPAICPPRPKSTNGVHKGLSASTHSIPVTMNKFSRSYSKPEPANGLPKPSISNAPPTSPMSEAVSRTSSSNSVFSDHGTAEAKPAIVIQVNGRDEEPRGLVSALRETYMRRCWAEDKYPPHNRGKSAPNLVELTARKFEPQRINKGSKLKKSWVDSKSAFLHIPMQVVP